MIAASLAVLRYLVPPVDVTFADFQFRSVNTCAAGPMCVTCNKLVESRTFRANCFSAPPWRLLPVYCSRIVLHLGELSLARWSDRERGFLSAFNEGSNLVRCEAVWLTNGCPRVSQEDGRG